LSQDEIKAKVSVPGLIKATVSTPEQLTGTVAGQVMFDPNVNLIQVNGVAVSQTNPVPVEITDGTNFLTPAKESGGNLAAAKADLDTISGQLDAKTSTLAKESGGNLATIVGQLDSKTSTFAKESGGNLAALAAKDFATQTTLAAVKSQTDKLVFDASSNLKTAPQGTVTVTGTVAISGTPTVELKTDDVGLARESGGNLAGAKGDLDTLVTQVDAKTSTLAKESGGNLASIKADVDHLDVNLSTVAKESGGNLAAAKTDLDTISGQLDAKTSTLARESGGNLAAAKADLDTVAGQLDAKTSTLAKETGGNLASIKSDADSIVTNTTGLAKESGGNLASIKSDADSIVTNTAVPNIRPLTTTDQVTIGDILLALKQYIDVLSRPLWWNPNTNALRVDTSPVNLPTYASGATLPTVSTVTTCSTVTTLSQLGGVGIFDVFLRGQWMNQWSSQVRPRMTTS
jgi:hypothetical protein